MCECEWLKQVLVITIYKRMARRLEDSILFSCIIYSERNEHANHAITSIVTYDDIYMNVSSLAVCCYTITCYYHISLLKVCQKTGSRIKSSKLYIFYLKKEQKSPISRLTYDF